VIGLALNNVAYLTSTLRLAPGNVATTKVMAVHSKPTTLNSAAELMYHHWSKHRM
jgi:hypothetical protein